MKKGFTLLELIIAMAILAVISVIVLSTLQSFNNNQALDKDTQAVVAYLDEAKNKTIASKNAAQYGVRMASSSVTLFKGSSYNAADTENQTYTFNSVILINTLSLQGGGSDVVFMRLTGETSQNGTITLSSIRASSIRTVTIYKTGAIESN